MIFKVKYELAGGHIHCGLFAAKQSNMTWAKCGNFVIRSTEFEDIQLAMSGVFFDEIVREEEDVREPQSRPDEFTWE